MSINYNVIGTKKKDGVCKAVVSSCNNKTLWIRFKPTNIDADMKSGRSTPNSIIWMQTEFGHRQCCPLFFYFWWDGLVFPWS
mmetsp:Transcript_3601/g.5593  ORF Transcript_3601/g.5593 Transcript_3601/m.5593 type:complete len:82 (+) Transcript_3601:985-1230(+)